MQTVQIPCEIAGHKVTNSAYPCVFLISKEAVAEKSERWREYGMACGGCDVDHPDWQAVWDGTPDNGGNYGRGGYKRVCCMNSETGKGFTGLLRRDSKTGKFSLEG